jgi:hypothetical protein
MVARQDAYSEETMRQERRSLNRSYRQISNPLDGGISDQGRSWDQQVYSGQVVVSAQKLRAR